MPHAQPPPVPAHLRKKNQWWNHPVPIWSLAVLPVVIFLILEMAQRPLVEVLWRKHHPAITDAMRNAIDQEEKRIDKEALDQVMRQFSETLGEPGGQPPATPHPK